MNTATTPPSTGQSHDPVRRWLDVEHRPTWVQASQTPLGQLVLACIALLAGWNGLGPWCALLGTAASLLAARCLLNSETRHQKLLFAATWMSVLVGTATEELDTAAMLRTALAQAHWPTDHAVALATATVPVVAIAMTLALWWVRSQPKLWLARRPMLALLCLTGGLTCAASLATYTAAPAVLTGVLWIGLFVWTPYLWFLPYAIMDLRSRTQDPLLPHLAVLRPYWSPTYLPFGKGQAFLRRHRASDPTALAVTQIKGAKLLLWGMVLNGLYQGLDWLFPGVPAVHDAIDAFLAVQPASIALGWAALVLSTARLSLQIAMWAHLFIGLARLAGYRLPRGSWRPLESRTLMDYFNRFHYYFKELLVDFFFVPTFFRVFKSHPRLRMFFATFMAAGVGNALWHFLRDIDLVASMGPAQALQTYASYAFYCTVLATGIGLSQVRAQQGRKPADGIPGRVWSFVVVWGFVVLLHVFSDGSRTHTLGERMRFLLSLFGV